MKSEHRHPSNFRDNYMKSRKRSVVGLVHTAKNFLRRLMMIVTSLFLPYAPKSTL